VYLYLLPDTTAGDLVLRSTAHGTLCWYANCTFNGTRLNRNLTFAAARDIEGGSRATVPADCRRVATLLGINPDGLERAMCTRHSTINGETTVIPLSPEKALDQRESLAKYVYGKIFDTVVARVNSSLYRGKVGSNIGVLDIFGFEVFQVNSFEQLCINYCNERLQTFFNEIIFEGEMKMYQAEGLPCDDISFQVQCLMCVICCGAALLDGKSTLLVTTWLTWE
jgi:myosin heavy subunit